MTDLLTHNQAAERLKVCPKTLRRIRANGLIPYVTPTPGRIYYRPEDLDAYLVSCVRVDVPSAPTRRASTRRAQKHSNVVSFMEGHRARREARGR